MKTTRNYLEKTSKHLFQFKNEKETFYMKIYVKGDDYYVLKFDTDLNLKSSKKYKITETVSPNGKTYVPTSLKNWTLFYKGYYPNFYKVTTIKHFKKFYEKFYDEVEFLTSTVTP